MSEETPIARIRKLIELMEKLPDDIQILLETADEETMKEIAEMAIKIMNLPYKIQMEMAKKVCQLTTR